MMRLWLAVILLAASALGETETNAPSATLSAAVARREFQMGQALLRENNFAGAAEAFQRATQAKPDMAEAYQQWGMALLQLGRLAGTLHLRGQRLQEAAAKFSRAAELRPEDRATWLLWSESLVLIGDLPVEPALRLGCYQGAVEKCRKAVELAPKDWEPYYHWANILTTKLVEFATDERARIGFHKEAAVLYSNAVERATFSGDIGRACANWGAALVRAARATSNAEERQKLLREAIAKFEQSARAVPNAAVTHTMWGSALVQLGKLTRLRNEFRDAVNQFNLSLSLNPDDPATLYALACAHALMGNPIMTIETLKRCFAVDPTDSYRQLALQDPDLASLRDEPSFKELFAIPSPRPGPPADNPPLRDRPR